MRKLNIIISATILLFIFVPIVITSAFGTTVTLSANKDTYVDQNAASGNFGTNKNRIFVSSFFEGTDGKNERSLIQFDLSQIPSGSSIVSAELYLYMYASTGPAINDLHRITAPWTETGATWISWVTPGGDYDPIVTSSAQIVDTSAAWIKFDVTSDVQSFVDGTPNYGWLIKDYEEDSSNIRTIGYRPREYTSATLRPYLEVTYTTAAAHPAIAVSKTANVTEAGVGNVIGYSIRVNNTGDVNLTDVRAYDNLTAHLEDIGDLASGKSFSFNLTYKVTENDLCKPLVNNVTANGTAISGTKVENFSIKTVNIVSHPAIAVSKIANVTEASVGDVVGYTIRVNNTGDVSLKNVTAYDNLTGHLENIGSLAAGADFRFNTTYQVAESDRNTTIINKVTANGTSPSGVLVQSFDTASVKAIAPIVVPVAAFSANVTSGSAPLSVQFTDLSTNSPTSWSWDFDNDSTVDSTEQNPSHTYNAAGSYTVKLVVNNSVGSDDEVKSAYIVVSESASPASDFIYTSRTA